MLIVGLGNPGPAYAETRHNIGFMVIDELLRRNDCSSVKKSSFEGELHKCLNCFLLKPMTFMNHSGRSVAAVKKFYKQETVVTIHDDLDIPFGTLRIKRGGGHGGHNGLKSMDAMISKDYIRVRMGIGHPGDRHRVADYVLSRFNGKEQLHLASWIAHTADCVEMLLHEPLENVASRYSIRKSPELS